MATVEDLLRILHANQGKNVFDGLSPPQLQFIQDKSKFKAALCTRQAGKTEAAIAYLTHLCLSAPNSNCVYINRTLKQAKAVIWQRFRQFFNRFDIKVKANQNEQSLTFENGSVLYISGAQDQEDADRFRGLICRLIIIDEAQGFRPEILKYLLEKVLDACLFRHGGTLALCGTPDTICNGFFFDVTKRDSQLGWSTTRWSWADNPGWANKDDFIKAVKAQHGWNGSEPEFISEWCGEWTKDNRSLLFEGFQVIKNEVQSLPTGFSWRYTLGADVGATRDLSAFVLIAWSMQTPTCYVVNAEGLPGRDVTGFCQNVDKYYRTIPELTVIMDDGALGAGYLKELQNRWRIPAIGKTKTPGYKAGMVRIINDQFRLNRIALKSDATGALRDQLQMVRFDEATQIENKADPCDYADAFVYGFSHVYSFLHTPEPPPLSVPERLAVEDEERWQRTVKQFQTQEELDEEEFLNPEAPELLDWPE
jgi:hypothetical protein